VGSQQHAGHSLCVSPLLANIYLHRLDRAWQGAGGVGVLVRYCDDLVVLCRSREEAERALAALRSILADLGLAPKAAKTRVVHLVEGGEGLDFLGFHHRWVRAKGLRSPARTVPRPLAHETSDAARPGPAPRTDEP
jgi:hypothetical protein